MPNKLTGEVIVEYLKKFPSTASMTLAKKIYNENKELFTSVDHARTMIRSYRGKVGDRNRGAIKNIIPKIELPKPDTKEWTPFIIPKSVTKLLILCDIHLPYHDLRALEVALEYGKKEGIDGILINGDLLDFYQLSRFDKDPRKRHLSGELDMARQFFDYLRQEFECPIYYKLGNHCERYEKYLSVKAPELLDIQEFRLEILLQLGEKRVTLIDDKRIIKHDSLDILHGHEFFGAPSQAVNPARGIFLKTMESCVIGHLHKSSSHTEMSMGGRLISTHSIGCLCDLTPEYARINKWNHGFAINELHKGGGYSFHNKRILSGKVY